MALACRRCCTGVTICGTNPQEAHMQLTNTQETHTHTHTHTHTRTHTHTHIHTHIHTHTHKLTTRTRACLTINVIFHSTWGSDQL